MSECKNFKLIALDGNRQSIMTATSEAGLLVIENTQNEKRAMAWRSTSLSAQTITAVMPITANGGGIVLAYTNLTMGAEVEAELINGLGTVETVTLECLGYDPGGTTTWVAWFEGGPVDQFEVVISDEGNEDGYMQVTQILCGPYLSPGNGLRPEVSMEFTDDIELIMTAGQSPRSEGMGIVRRAASIDLPVMNTQDRNSLIQGLITPGRKYPVFISIYDEWSGYLQASGGFVAKIQSPLQTQHWQKEKFRSSLDFIEV